MHVRSRHFYGVLVEDHHGRPVWPSIAVSGRLDTIHWRKQVLLALEEALALSMVDTSVPSPHSGPRRRLRYPPLNGHRVIRRLPNGLQGP